MTLSNFFLLNSKLPPIIFFFFFNDTATTEIYTLSLHDALPISSSSLTDLTDLTGEAGKPSLSAVPAKKRKLTFAERSEEQTPELQSQSNFECRLLLEKKKKKNNKINNITKIYNR